MKHGVLYLDPREGSGKLAEPLRREGLSVTGKKLNSADVAFLGHDEQRIGIELKTLGDFYASFRSSRLAGHQVRELVKDYDRRYLIIQGLWKVLPTGQIAIRRGRLWVTSWFKGSHGLSYDEMEGHLITLEERAGISWRHTTTQVETVKQIKALHHWWTGKAYTQHGSHLAFHREVDPQLLSTPTLARKWAKELPGVGWDRALAIEQHFASAQALALADEKTWREVKGIGRTLSKRIVAAIEKERK